MKTTRPTLDLPAIREALAIRAGALAELLGADAGPVGRPDRLADIAWANGLIRREAERCGLLPVEAIGRATR